jgi:hypothetical protein
VSGWLAAHPGIVWLALYLGAAAAMVAIEASGSADVPPDED